MVRSVMSQPWSEPLAAPQPSTSTWRGSGILMNAMAIATLIFGAVVLSVSYLDEDAFISFRVVENFVRGHGLRWNVDERVQVYTHPLWVILLIPLRLVLGNIGAASYVLSWLASVTAFLLVARTTMKSPRVLAVALLMPLLLSQSFTDYTSSGLENPLVFLLLACFVGQLETIGLQRATVCASLLALARPDSILLVAPLLGGLAARELRSAGALTVGARRLVKAAVIGGAPLWCWFAFSLLYYGFLWPNPKYAKLGGGVATSTYLGFGLNYLLDIARNDTVTFGGLSMALAWVARRVKVTVRSLFEFGAAPLDYEARVTLLLSGVVAYTIYVVWIGGDFMAGRHWAAPFFLTVASLAAWAARLAPERQNVIVSQVFIVAMALRFGVQSFTAQKHTIQQREQGRTAMIRKGGLRVQRYNCGFFEALFGSEGPLQKHTWSQRGLKAKAAAEKFLEKHPGERYVYVESAAGKSPFFAGPDAVAVDPLGITDPLLARLPDEDGKISVIGHLGRKVPSGYVDARRTGDLGEMEPHLGRYYAALRSITSDPVFAASRLRTLVAFHSGEFDADLNQGIEQLRTRGEGSGADSEEE